MRLPYRMTSLPNMIRTLLCLAFVVLLAGCDDNEIKTYRVSKEASDNASTVAQKSMEAAASGATGSSEPAATSPPAILQAPKNWEVQARTSMRAASYIVKGDAGTVADVSLIILDGGAGNTLDNVNRWLGQLGQQPISAERLSAISQKITTALGEAAVVDLEGLPQGADAAKDGRILAAIAKRNNETWFFKMRGNVSLVTAEKDHFLEWVRSAKLP